MPDTSITACARAGSPQPLTAAAARAACARSTADDLTADNSAYAICRDDPQLLHDLVMQINSAKAAGLPKGTASADAWGFGWAVAFGKDTNTRWMTPRLSDPNINMVTERWRTSICLFWVAHHMSPSARRRKQGFDKAKPTSPLLAIYGWRRVLGDCDRYVSDMGHVKPILKGLCALVKKQYGLAALAVHQAKVFSAAMLLAIATVLQGSGVATWSTALTEAWGVMHPYLIATGTRKEEITAAFTGDDNIMRANFVWIDDDGNELRMTIEVIRSRRNGHLLRATGGASKCDRLFITWAKQKQFFRYGDSDPLNFPVAFQRWELAYPCPLESRATWPAFSPTGDEHPFSPHTAVTTHKQLVQQALGAEGAEGVTIHSYRHSLICAMYVARSKGHRQFTEGIMQAHVRHKTLDAMYGYNKMMPSTFADNVAIITRTDPSTAKRDDLPEYEPLGAVEAVEAAIDELDGLGNNAKPAAAPTARAAPTAAAAAPPPKPAKPRTVTIIGDATPVATREPETWHVVGSRISLPNELWGEDDGGSSACTIAHFLNVYRFPNGGSHVAYAVTIDGYDGLYAVRATAISRYADADTKKRLRKKGMPRPVAAAPRHPAGSPPPSPPPSPKGGDTFGTRKKTAANWGTSDKATRERARRNRWAKLRRAFEREAWAASHPQECPVCMEQEMTHLLYRCGLNVEPFHRHHGLCGECAQTILDTTATCPLCNLPVEGALHVGTAAFA